ncbi:MAG TPA: chromate efflux transporter [Anaerolineales bacterium]|nr:chromate efflux transporter [Anaerolineales bacterium]
MIDEQAVRVPQESYGHIFLRFLKFGLLAWGGPVAQIAMIRQELVDEEHWVTNERFNRVLAVYQVLPGPEAHELCVYFGMLSAGRLGAILAGLGFMLPGFLFMLALSWFYVTYGITSPVFAAIFYGFQASIGGLIIRAVHRIGEHALHDRWLWAIAILSATAKFLNFNFLIVLVLGGLIYAAARRQVNATALHILLPPMVGIGLALGIPSVLQLFGYGLRAGLLTFGGAYTVIPFLQQDAVVRGAWMTNQQFLDGLALSSILPAPLIIFSTFIGYLGHGLAGAVMITVGIFLPAFGFTLIGHQLFERLVDNQRLHAFLDGVTAAVVGLIAATALELLQVGLPDIPAVLIFILSLIAVYQWKAKTAVAVIVVCAGLLGLLVKMLL